MGGYWLFVGASEGGLTIVATGHDEEAGELGLGPGNVRTRRREW